VELEELPLTGRGLNETGYDTSFAILEFCADNVGCGYDLAVLSRVGNVGIAFHLTEALHGTELL
jgi:hypothetical protein